MEAKKLSKVATIAELNKRGYHVDGPNYGKQSGYMTTPNGERVYVNFRDLLTELTR